MTKKKWKMENYETIFFYQMRLFRVIFKHCAASVNSHFLHDSELFEAVGMNNKSCQSTRETILKKGQILESFS